MSFLVVDDDIIFRTLAKQKFDDEGANSILAEDGAAALRLAVVQPVDLVLVDLGLPDIDGFELIARLRNLPQTSEVPIIVVTGRDDADAINRAFSVGATSFMTKPINWKLFEHHVFYVLHASVVERDARAAKVRAEAESRVKSLVTNRIDYSIRPLVRQVMLAAEQLSTTEARLPGVDGVSEKLAGLYNAAARIQDEFSSMIFLYRAVSGNLDLHDQTWSARALIDEVIRKIMPLARERTITLQPVLPSDGILVRGDRDKLTTALHHLAVNGLRYSPPHTCLHIGADSLHDGSLRLFVEDEGPGIEADLLAQLLAPSGRAISDVKCAKLSGLGLALCKMVVEGHGGDLVVRSAPGSGTAASLLLPVSRIFMHRHDAA